MIFHLQNLALDPNCQLHGKVAPVDRSGTKTVAELRTQDETPFCCARQNVLEIEVSQDLSFDFDPSLAHLF